MTRLSPDSSRFARLTTLATAAGLMTALMTSIASADINIELRPEQPGYHVNDTVRIGIYLVSDDATDQSFSAATIMFGWNPAHLELLGVDNTGAVPLLFSDLPADGNVNETLPPADGTGYYGLLANFGPPPVATPAGTLVTTLVFNAETEVCATPVTILAQAGSPPQQTVVYHGTIPNLDVTGTLGSTAVDIDSVAPTASAGSIGACYPSVAAAEAAAIAATSASDNCTPTNELIFNVSTTGTCDVTITLIVEDRAGNTAAPLDYFTRVDGTPPVIDAGSCPTSVSISALPGVCEADYTFAPPTYSDNCSGSITVDCVRDDAMALTDPYPVGVTTVTCTGTDGCGNVSTPCVFTVTVTDDEDPTLSGCPADIAVANDAGLCSAAVSWTPPTADDNCPGVVLSSTHNPGDTFPVGTTTVTYTAEDAAGHTVTCSFDVTVTDDEDPTLSGCPSDISVSNDAGLCSAAVSWTPPTADDNCPGVVLSSTHNPGDTFPVGTTTVTYTAEDAAGHTVTCSFDVTVTDDEDPTLSGCPSDISVSNDAGLCSAAVSWTPPTADDNCPGVTLNATHNPGDTFPVGTTTVTYTAEDAAGHTVTCSFDVTVTDDEDPTLSGCPADIAVANDAGLCSAAVSWTPPTADDNCPGVTLNATHNPGDTFPVGTTTVTYTAEDAAGHTVTCSFDVTVTDDEDPTIAGCPSDITVNLNQLMCQAVVSWTPPTATDNCPGVTLISSHNPGDTFDNGSTLVTYTATDAVGHTTLCTFTVTVVPVPDIDDDGDVDFDDLMLFVDVLLGIDTTPLHAARADANCDGLADGDDVQAFLVALYP